MEKNKLIIIATILIVVLVAIAGGAYYYLNYWNKEETVVKSPQKVASVCGDLVAQNGTTGKAPFVPIVKGTINGTYKASEKICQWFINGTSTHQSFPITGQCIFGGKPLYEPGTYAISYRIAGQSCTKSLNISVQK